MKEALRVGIENAIKSASQRDGFFGNEAIKILMPEKMKNIEQGLRTIGLSPKIDEVILSMNRAAEKSAPLAADIFATAITDMSFEDATKILNGGETVATDYFKDKTYDNLFAAFQPSVRKAMDDYAVTRKFEEVTGRAQSLPFLGQLVDVDVTKYVVSKALDGLFLLLSQEESKIRTDPSARVTQLLRDVFK